MIEVHFLIPVKGNDGKRFSPRLVGKFEDLLLELFNGQTGPSPAIGGSWRDQEGTVYRDTNVTYMVLIQGLIASAAKILKAVEFAKSNFGQLAITVRYLNHAEIL